MRAGLLLLLAACAGPARTPADLPPDEQALRRETLVRAEHARLVLSDRWRAAAKLEGIHREDAPDGEQIARGSAVFTVERLRIEANEIRVRWLADHQDLLVYATNVALFRQRRDQPYHSQDLAAVTLANDQVSFFQQ